MSKQQFLPGIGRKGKQFVVATGIVLQPEGELRWQEFAHEDDEKAAKNELNRAICAYHGVQGMVTPHEMRELERTYDGPPLIILERVETVRAAVGYVET